MRTLREWCLLYDMDPKSRIMQNKLIQKGILQHNGIPTRRQVAQGNFIVLYRRGIANRKTPKILVTIRGEEILHRIMTEI